MHLGKAMEYFRGLGAAIASQAMVVPRLRHFTGASIRHKCQVRVTAKPQLRRVNKVSARTSPMF